VNEYGAVVAWKWQRETEVLGEKRAPVPLCPPQISNWTALSGDAGDQPPDQLHAVLLTTMCHGAEIRILGVSGSDLTDRYGTTFSEQWTGQDTEGSGHDLIPCSTQFFEGISGEGKNQKPLRTQRVPESRFDIRI
jgi:hypothetical protein